MKIRDKWVLCFLICIMMFSSAFAQTYSKKVSIDIRFGDETYTNTFDVQWQETDKILEGYEVLGMIRVTGDKVSIRKDHKNDSDRIGYAYKDDVFYYINTRSYDQGWYQIQSGGWIAKQYTVRLSEDEMDQYAGSGTSSQTSYRLGDSGPMVTWIQESLKTLKYYKGDITGDYGSKTHDAVMKFQRDNGMSGDGIAGQKTIAKINEKMAGKTGTTSSTKYIYQTTKATAEALGWKNDCTICVKP